MLAISKVVDEATDLVNSCQSAFKCCVLLLLVLDPSSYKILYAGKSRKRLTLRSGKLSYFMSEDVVGLLNERRQVRVVLLQKKQL